MRPRSALGFAIVLLLSGCAAPLLGPDAVRGLAPCMPAEVAGQFFFWPVVAHQSITLDTEDGDAVQASWVLYRRGRSAVAVIWVNADVVAVDPSPDTDTPEWIDVSLVMPVDGKLVLRREPETPCQWKRWETPAEARLSRSA